jgi:peroxiredoxin Q/BCP
MSELAEGMTAPEFDLPRDGGGNVSLTGLAGKIVVVYFYPKDDTSGCTVEAIDFTALAEEFTAAGAVVIGMSPDPVKAHDKFVAKHQLGVILASDEDKSVLEAYGVWKEKSMYGRKYMGVERSTFIIGRDRNIAKVWHKVKVPGHAQAVLEAVKAV